MQSLLRWSIENSTPSSGDTTTSPPVRPRSDLDPAIIDQILGRPDAELMKEALQVALDEKQELDDRVQALDNFEMLIESIDNANDLEKLKMWEPLHGLLTSETSEDEIKRHVLWNIGTAVQNNPSAQVSYLSLKPLPTLLTFLTPAHSNSHSPKTRSRAVYALSGLLKHNSAAVRQLTDANGWEVLRGALGDSDIGVRRKVAFLIGTLVLPTGGEEDLGDGDGEGKAEQTTATEQTTTTATSTSTALGPVSSSTALGPVSSSTAVSLHPSSTSTSTSSSTTIPASTSQSTQIHTPSSSSAPVYPNSHASMLASPSFFHTSLQTARAIRDNGILDTLVDGLVNPVPFGVDGDQSEDEEFEGKVIGYDPKHLPRHTQTHLHLPPAQKATLTKFIEERLAKVGGDASALADRWSIGTEDVLALNKVLSIA